MNKYLNLITWPFIAFTVWVILTFLLHYLSGEGNMRGSGDPIMMVGAMLSIPVALIGFVVAVINLILD